MAHTEKCRGCLYENKCDYISCRKEENDKSFKVEDIKRLYNAFSLLCDYIETGTDNSCDSCPHKVNCFGANGEEFVKSLERIRKTLNMN